jgi:hypothetical protein
VTPLGFDQLGQQAATLLLNFVGLPAHTLHSDWKSSLIPDWALESPLAQDQAALSKSLLVSLNLTDDLSKFDFANPIHQAALMPPDALSGLARHLGLSLNAPAFLQVIERDKISALDQALTSDDWQLLATLPRHERPGKPLSTEDLASIAPQFSEDGLVSLIEIFRQEPRDIGQRALLKLPQSQRDSEPSLVAKTRDIFPTVYLHYVAHWHAAWPELWRINIQDTVY